MPGTGHAVALAGIATPRDLWDATAADDLDTLDALVYRSTLLGADRSVANQGGGNTSAKAAVVDHAGREQRVLWVKGSGTDLATITRSGFAALRLDEVEPLRSRETMHGRGDGRVPAALRARARPATPVHRDAPARVRGRRPRRPHAPRRGHRSDLVARRSLARRRGVRRGRGLARLPASGLRHVEADRGAPRRASARPCRPPRAPRPRHVGRIRPRRPTGTPSSSSRELPRR